ILKPDHSRTESGMRQTDFSRCIVVEQPLRTREDCQRHSNWRVVSFRRDINLSINRFSEWDGESYESTGKFFCTAHCAIDMARAVVDKSDSEGKNLALQPWHERMKQLKESQS